MFVLYLPKYKTGLFLILHLKKGGRGWPCNHMQMYKVCVGIFLKSECCEGGCLVCRVKWIWHFWLSTAFVRFFVSCCLIVFILGLLVFQSFGRFFQDQTIVQPEGAKIPLFFFFFFQNYMNCVANITLSCCWVLVCHCILKLDSIWCLWNGRYLHFEFEK
jgi:hypothetical protein